MELAHNNNKICDMETGETGGGRQYDVQSRTSLLSFQEAYNAISTAYCESAVNTTKQRIDLNNWKFPFQLFLHEEEA
jgi:hypothetical protein